MKNNVAWILALILILSIMIPAIIGARASRFRERDNAFNEGFRAKKHNVTSESNPYKYDEERKAWLNGWIEASITSPVEMEK